MPPMKNQVRNGIAIAIACLFAFDVLAADDIEVLQLRPNFYMIAGAGGNIGVQIGEDGVVVVDAGNASQTGAVIAAIKKLTTRPIRYLINTSADADHVGGNDAIAKQGQTLFTGGGGAGVGADFLGGGASILAHEKYWSA